MDDTIPQDASQNNLTPKTTFIYVLIDPETQEVRYVGKANNPQVRFGSHLRDKQNTHKTNWIRKLQSKGLKPLMEVIEEVPYEQWKEREMFWIAFYQAQGCNLTNSTGGGDGHDLAPESRAKISAAAKARKREPFSEEWRRKLGDIARGKKQSPEHVAKRTAKQLGSTHTPETRGKISAARKGKPLSPEAKAKIKAIHATPEYKKRQVASHKGFKHTSEAKAKIAAANRGKRVSPETREKLANANRGAKRSSETKAKIAAAKKNTSPETRAKISTSLTGKKLSPESIEKRSAAVQGKKRPPEVGAKISATKTGKKREPFSDEWKNNLRDASRGRKHSPESIEKMSLARKRWHAMKQNPPDAPTLFE